MKISQYLGLGLTLTLAGLVSQSAVAQNIHAGSATGSYTNAFCPQVQGTLKKQYFEHSCATSQGTGDNVEKVLTNPQDVGIGQFDIVAARALEQPDTLAIVNPNLGLECLYAVTSDKNIESLKGISVRMPIALPPEKSGSTATLYDSALDAVKAVINGDAALAFFVQFPDTTNAVFETINDAQLKFIPIINRQILRREVSGYRVYEPQQVVVTPAGLLGRLTGKKPTTVDTTCTPVVLFTGSPAQLPEGSTEREDQEEVVKLLSQVPRPESKSWQDTFKNAVAIGQDKFNELIEKYSN